MAFDPQTLISQLQNTLTDASYPAEQASALAESIYYGKRESSLPQERKLALLVTDVPGIQGLVSASSRPVTQTGASKALQSWDEETADQIIRKHRCTSLYIGGGTAVVIASISRVHALSEDLIQQAENSLHHTLVVAHLPVSIKELVEGPSHLTLPIDDKILGSLGVTRHGEGGFGNLLSKAMLELQHTKGRLNKDHRPWDTRRCHECGIRPGVRKRSIEGEDAIWCCETCDAFHTAGSRGREKEKEAKNFEDVMGGEALAILFIDGSRFGEAFKKQQTIQAYCELSHIISTAFSPGQIKEVAKEFGLCDASLPTQQLGKKRMSRYQILRCGGDDIAIALPAGFMPQHDTSDDRDLSEPGKPRMQQRRQTALHFAVRLLEVIEEKLKASPVERLGLGAGAGLCTSKGLTAHAALSVAQALCKYAKKRIDVETKEEGASIHRSGIDFERLTESSLIAEGIDTLRKHATQPWEGIPGDPQQRTQFHCYYRPYNLREAHELLSWIDDVSKEQDTVKSQLYRIREELSQDPLQGLITAHYLLSRHTSLAQRLKVNPADVGDIPQDTWLIRSGHDGWYSPLFDLVDILAWMRPGSSSD